MARAPLSFTVHVYSRRTTVSTAVVPPTAARTGSETQQEFTAPKVAFYIGITARRERFEV